MKFHHRAVPIVLLVLLLDAIGFGIVLPVLPSLIVHLADVTVAQATRIAGYMLVAYAAMQFLAGPIMGNLGDRFGRRIVLLGCTLAFTIDYGLMAAAPTIGWLFLGRLIAGIAGASYGPANAVLADVTEPQERARVFGLMGAAFGGGFIVGPAVGGLIASLGVRAPFIVAAAMAAINFVWIAVALPETLATDKRRPFDWRRANPLGTFGPLAFGDVNAIGQALQARGRVKRDDPAQVDYADSIAQLIGLLHIVRGQQNRATLALDLQDQLAQIARRLRVEPDRRLVQQQHRRVGQQRFGDRDPLLHAG